MKRLLEVLFVLLILVMALAVVTAVAFNWYNPNPVVSAVLTTMGAICLTIFLIGLVVSLGRPIEFRKER